MGDQRMTKSSRKTSAGSTSDAAHAALDVMLTDAAGGGRSRFIRPGQAIGVAAGLARRPDRAARRLGGLGAELARVASGRSDVRAAKRDRRFADSAWNSSWLFRRLLQTHLAVGEAVDGLSPTPTWTGATSARPGSPLAAWSTRSPRATSGGRAPPSSRRSSTIEAPT